MSGHGADQGWNPTSLGPGGGVASVFGTYQFDAFGALRVSSPYTLADLISKYGRDPRDWDTDTTGGGQVQDDLANSAIVLSVGATDGDEARLRTNTYFRYQAGKGLTFRMTVFHADLGQADQRRRWGYFDDNDGLFWQLTGTTLQIVRRTSVSGTPSDTDTTDQANWNVDPLNGTGPSGVDLDIRNGNIYEIRFQWLGVGVVYFYVNSILVHKMDHPNMLPSVYMRTATLPAAAEITNTDTSDASEMTVICVTVLVDGGSPPPEFTWTYSRSTPTIAGNTSKYMFAIRPAATFKTVENRCLVLPILAELASETNRCSFQVIVNPTITGASWAVSTPAESCVQVDIAGAYTLGTGQVIAERFGPSGGAAGAVASQDLRDLFGVESGMRKMRQSGFAGSLDTLLIYATNEQAGNTDLRATLTWGEIR